MCIRDSYKAVVTKMLYLGEYVRDNCNKISNKAEMCIRDRKNAFTTTPDTTRKIHDPIQPITAFCTSWSPEFHFK